MSSKKVFVSGCPWCRSMRKPWNHQIKDEKGNVICSELLKYVCPCCGENGHSQKHCSVYKARQQQYESEKRQRELERQQRELERQRESERFKRWEANQQAKKERIEKEKEKKANSWAGIISKTRSQEVIAKIKEDEQKEKERAIALKKKKYEEALARAAEWERTYPLRMAKKYGIPNDNLIATPGKFWEFYVEGTQDDKELAASARKNEAYQLEFVSYLQEKFYTNWLYVTEDNKHDCVYLCNLRRKISDEEFERELEEREREREEEKRIDEEIDARFKRRDEMEEKWAKREITREEWNNFLAEEEEYDDDMDTWLEHNSLQIYSAMEKSKQHRDAWLAREKERDDQRSKMKK